MTKPQITPAQICNDVLRKLGAKRYPWPRSIREAKKMGWPVYRRVTYYCVMPDGVVLALPHDIIEETAYSWRKRRKKTK